MTDMPPPGEAIPGAAPPPAPPTTPRSTPVPTAAPTPGIGAAGPLGKSRSPWLVILLCIVTLGIWMLVWSYQNGDELKQRARTGLGGVAYLVITLFISPVTMFLMASEVENLYRNEGKEPPITTIWGLWFLLPLIGPFIWYFRIQGALNDYWTSHGSTVSSGV